MAKTRSLGNLIGGLAFLIGVVLAIIAGFIGLSSQIVMALVIIGLIVGLLNIGDREVMPFLFSGLVLVLISSSGDKLIAIIPYADGILTALLAIFIPATVIVAVKNVFGLARAG